MAPLSSDSNQTEEGLLFPQVRKLRLTEPCAIDHRRNEAKIPNSELPDPKPVLPTLLPHSPLVEHRGVYSSSQSSAPLSPPHNLPRSWGPLPRCPHPWPWPRLRAKPLSTRLITSNLQRQTSVQSHFQFHSSEGTLLTLPLTPLPPPPPPPTGANNAREIFLQKYNSCSSSSR